jgi:hypothetical protein
MSEMVRVALDPAELAFKGVEALDGRRIAQPVEVVH